LRSSEDPTGTKQKIKCYFNCQLEFKEDFSTTAVYLSLILRSFLEDYFIFIKISFRKENQQIIHTYLQDMFILQSGFGLKKIDAVNDFS